MSTTRADEASVLTLAWLRTGQPWQFARVRCCGACGQPLGGRLLEAVELLPGDGRFEAVAVVGRGEGQVSGAAAAEAERLFAAFEADSLDIREVKL